MELENTGVEMTDELEKLIREDAIKNGLEGKVTVDLKAKGYKNAKIGLRSELPEPDTVASVRTKGSPEVVQEAKGFLDTYLETQKTVLKDFTKAMFGVADSRERQATATERYGTAVANAVTSKGNVDVAKILHQANIANILNADVNNPDNAIVAAQKMRAEAQYKMDKLRPIIDAEDKVQVWDDPLRWIANQFTQPALKSEYNAAARLDATMVKRIAETTQLADAVHKISPAMVVADIQRNAAAGAEAAHFEAVSKAAEARAQGGSAIAQALLQDSLANEHTLDKKFRLATMFMESRNYNRAVGIDEKNAAADARLQGPVDALNLKLEAWKMPPVTVAQLKLMDRNKVEAMLDWAQDSAYGKGPGDTWLNIQRFATPAKVKDADGVLVEFITKLSISKEYQDLEKTKQLDQKFQSLPLEVKRATLLQELFQNQQDELSRTGGNNSKLSAGNPYKLLHLQTSLMEEMKGNPFVKVVGEAAALSPTKTVDDKQLLLSALGQAEAEPAKRAILAQDLAEYYTKAAAVQWLKGGAAMTGYPRPTRYGVTDPYSPKTINMMSALEIEAWLSRRMAARASMTRVSDTGFFSGAMTDFATPFGDPMGINK